MDKSTIRRLNDRLRQSIDNGEGRDQVVYSKGVRELRAVSRRAILSRVAAFNDPEFINGEGEHAYGELHHGGHEVVWTIEYFDASILGKPSSDPSNPEVTNRVLTIMLWREFA